MASPILTSPPADTELVTQSLAGDHAAFGTIVQRYQSLVCALAFSATGNISRSEDLAQETFLTAWRQLRSLREPAKLRSWLCGITRNTIRSDRRQQGHEPAHRAEPLEAMAEFASTEPAPPAQTISTEEAALLWREVGQLPEIYREPLVLFYREQQSVARVAAALELSEDAVMQRLSRGRKQLQERMLVFVEGALARTNPGSSFVLGVQAALPLAVIGAKGTGLAAMKSLLGKAGGLFGFILIWIALPFLGAFVALIASWISVRQAPNPRARRFLRNWHCALWGAITAWIVGNQTVNALAAEHGWSVQTAVTAGVIVWCCYLSILSGLLVLLYRWGTREAGRPFEWEHTATPRPRTDFMVVGTYFFTAAWLIALAWLLGDRLTAWLLIGATVGLAMINLRHVEPLTGIAAHRLNFHYHAVLCGLLLGVVNLRVDRWLAPLYQVSLDEMHRLLPMGTVHLLTLILLGWIGLLLIATRREPPDDASASEG